MMTNGQEKLEFGCCRCSTRAAVMVVALISTLHFVFESAAVIAMGEDHATTMISSTTPYFYAMVGAQFFMVLVSILLWVGAYFTIFWFCIPWLFMTFLNILYHLYVLIALIIKMIILFDWIKVQMFIFVLISCAVLSYMDGIVVAFVSALIRNVKPTNRRKDEEEHWPLLNNQ